MLMLFAAISCPSAFNFLKNLNSNFFLNDGLSAILAQIYFLRTILTTSMTDLDCRLSSAFPNHQRQNVCPILSHCSADICPLYYVDITNSQMMSDGIICVVSASVQSFCKAEEFLRYGQFVVGWQRSLHGLRYCT